MNSVNRVVKRAKSRFQLPDDAVSHARKVGPFLLIAGVLVYLLLGAAAFLSLEHSDHEHEISKFYLNFGVRRYPTAPSPNNSKILDANSPVKWHVPYLTRQTICWLLWIKQTHKGFKICWISSLETTRMSFLFNYRTDKHGQWRTL